MSVAVDLAVFLVDHEGVDMSRIVAIVLVDEEVVRES